MIDTLSGTASESASSPASASVPASGVAAETARINTTPGKTDKKVKAVALLSGGLDSTLAINVLKEQGVDITALNFSTVLNVLPPSGKIRTLPPFSRIFLSAEMVLILPCTPPFLSTGTFIP